MVVFYKKLEKYNEFQLTKKKRVLNNRKMKNHPPSPVVKKKVLYSVAIENLKLKHECFIQLLCI